MDKAVRIQISAGAFLLPAVLLLLLPIQWVFAMIAAAAVHEFCHILAIYMVNQRLFGITIGMHGARIETEPMQPGKELICAIAGPLGSAALLLMARWFPRLAICGAVHCFYNCLPLFPFDGGRILQCLIAIFISPGRSEKVFMYTQVAVRLLLAIALLVLGTKFGWGILVFGIVLIKSVRRKTSCQQTLLAIQ